MNQRDLDRTILSVLDESDRMFLATSVDQNPSGATVFFARDGFDLLFFTFRTTRKAEQIRYNPKVQAVVWPKGQEGIRGLQIEGECRPVTDPEEMEEAKRRILRVTSAFKDYMEDEFLLKNKVVGYFRLRPTVIKYVDFYAEPKFRWREFPENQPGPVREAFRSVWNRLRIWVRALRAPFFTATLVPVLLGAVIAHRDLAASGSAQFWNWSTFWWVLLGALLAHAGTNITNDYYDHTSRNDEWNTLFSPFNGGSRMIQAGLLPAWKVLLAGLLCFAATVAVGLRLNSMITGSPLGNSPLLWIGVTGVALGLFYTMSPVRIGYHGLGELAIFLGFGPVMVLGTHYVLLARYLRETGTNWPWLTPFLASVPVGILIMLVVWINQFQDAPADEKAGKRTWVVRLAARKNGVMLYEKPFRFYTVFLLSAFVLILVLGLVGSVYPELVSPYVLIALLPGYLAWKAVRWGKEWLHQWNQPGADRTRLPYELLRVNASTIGIHFLTGLLLVFAFLLGQ
jgi:1,4-dihydroxy-2-naphthoate octaprenyltransferase